MKPLIAFHNDIYPQKHMMTHTVRKVIVVDMAEELTKQNQIRKKNLICKMKKQHLDILPCENGEKIICGIWNVQGWNTKAVLKNL